MCGGRLGVMSRVEDLSGLGRYNAHARFDYFVKLMRKLSCFHATFRFAFTRTIHL